MHDPNRVPGVEDFDRVIALSVRIIDVVQQEDLVVLFEATPVVVRLVDFPHARIAEHKCELVVHDVTFSDAAPDRIEALPETSPAKTLPVLTAASPRPPLRTGSSHSSSGLW